jgi:hypothetical protein
VILSLGLLVGSKAIGVQVPFVFKHIIDSFSADLIVTAPDAFMAAPLALVFAYGLARSTAAGMQELRNAIFATVALQLLYVPR